MIGVVDYEAGNISSVSNALSKVGAPFIVSNDAGELSKCSGIILPGVGAAPGAMQSLRELNLVEFLRTSEVPLLGICLGMQLLYEASEEGDTRCLGVVPGVIGSLNGRAETVPHMGWNRVRFFKESPVATDLLQEEYFYFAHSYVANVGPSTIAIADCGVEFTAVLGKDRVYGVQFHPEKSGSAGLRLMQNFTSLCSSFRPSTSAKGSASD